MAALKFILIFILLGFISFSHLTAEKIKDIPGISFSVQLEHTRQSDQWLGVGLGLMLSSKRGYILRGSYSQWIIKPSSFASDYNVGIGKTWLINEKLPLILVLEGG
ncbi:MAG: hypothetical protein ACE5QV_07470, partial [Fidelibacterota bacterium]